MNKPSENDILLVLNGKSTKSAEEVARWLSSSEGQKWIQDNTEMIFHYCEESKSDALVPTEKMLRNIHKEINRLKKRKRNRFIAVVAAAILIPIALITVLWQNVNNRVGNVLLGDVQMMTENASMGEKKVIVFQDGTKIYLNAGSKIIYPSLWSLKKRNVILQGEGFFDVVKNPNRPLEIDLSGAILTVHGTKFNLKAYPNDRFIDVVLYEGELSFKADGKEYAIKPLEKLKYNRHSKIVEISNPKSIGEEILWTENVIYFKNTPLKEMLSTLSRWYNVDFFVEDEEIYSRTFTLKTEHQALHTLLEELKYISDIDFIFEADTIKVRKKKRP